jgi:hypothetical protein
MKTRISFTDEDLREIYYALESKIGAPVTGGNDKVAREWRKHLSEIMERIEEVVEV